ncbi:hypothetical protein E1301_Tti009250 [Triplophysa tibetana]|uniref:Uncharacterized protein n=1 Tax=Triplophysa tibetana TaxID=1572043 RepID=A0A5A9NU81_9TELE|nr:hypothetical protein E1301_Tti009250 [Triplophysa tibetana]
MFHVKRNRAKDHRGTDKVKSLFRRSLSMNDLLQAEACLDEDLAEKILQHSNVISKIHSTSWSSIHHYCSVHGQKKNLNQGLNVKSRRDHSASSSGEFDVSFENVAWSSDSSPYPDPLYRHHRSSDNPSPAQPGHDESKPGSSSGSGVRRSSSGRSTGDRSFHKLDKACIGLYKTQSVQSTESDLKSALESQGKSSSVSGCLNCFATPMRSPKPGHDLSGLPRASCVISTSEGNSRRASVHSTASGRSVASLSNKNAAEPQLNQCDKGGLKETTDLKAEDRKTEKKSDSEFTIESVFTNTIFSEAS